MMRLRRRRGEHAWAFSSRRDGLQVQGGAQGFGWPPPRARLRRGAQCLAMSFLSVMSSASSTTAVRKLSAMSTRKTQSITSSKLLTTVNTCAGTTDRARVGEGGKVGGAAFARGTKARLHRIREEDGQRHAGVADEQEHDDVPRRAKPLEGQEHALEFALVEPLAKVVRLSRGARDGGRRPPRLHVVGGRRCAGALRLRCPVERCAHPRLHDARQDRPGARQPSKLRAAPPPLPLRRRGRGRGRGRVRRAGDRGGVGGVGAYAPPRARHAAVQRHSCRRSADAWGASVVVVVIAGVGGILFHHRGKRLRTRCTGIVLVGRLRYSVDSHHMSPQD